MPAQASPGDVPPDAALAELVLCSLLQTVRITPTAATLAPEMLDTALAYAARPGKRRLRPRPPPIPPMV